MGEASHPGDSESDTVSLRPPEREERVKFPTGEGQKRAKFWAVWGRAGLAEGRSGRGVVSTCLALVGVLQLPRTTPTRAKHVYKKKGNINKSKTQHTAKHTAKHNTHPTQHTPNTTHKKSVFF